MKLVRNTLTTFVAVFGTIASLPAFAQEVVPEARALLSKEIVDKGSIAVAGAMVWPPYLSKLESQDVVGLEADLMRILAAKLGLAVEFHDIKFATVIPSIENGRYDVALGQLGITKKRLNVVDFIPSTYSRLGLLTAPGKSSLDVNNLCGHSLAVTIGSAEVPLVDSLSKKCESDGKSPISVNEYPDTPSSYLAVSNARAEGFVLTRAVAVYMSKQNPRLEVSDTTVNGYVSLSGMMIGKSRPELKAALGAALDSAIADGSYSKILEKFDVKDIAITSDVLRKPLAEIAVD
jgi:polar amino acid transport system substrate-binding protein